MKTSALASAFPAERRRNAPLFPNSAGFATAALLMSAGCSLGTAIAQPRLVSPSANSPLAPSDAASAFQLADEQLAIQLVAAEPQVFSPVAVAWDAAGSLFVAEMRDYPLEREGGRIRRLEDRDADGYYETSIVFAESLAFPNSVLPWDGGLLVTAAPDLWFLKDHDQDGRADERRVLFTGFGQGNQQLRANGLFLGLDNWVYGANGRNDGEIRKPDEPAEKAVSIRRRDFRFRPGTGQFEAIAGFSQFGLAHDDWGRRFPSWNTIPIRHVVIEEAYLQRVPELALGEPAFDLLPPGDRGEVFPLTPPPLVFNAESSSHFNALAGLTIFRGDALGAQYQGNAFVGESLRNLVHRRVLEPKGVTFQAPRGEEGREFLASTDPWFHPVNFATGPDGALYIVDFYRQFVEHPNYAPASLRDKVAWRTGAEHGRIWRVHRRGRKPAMPKLPPARASVTELVELLQHPNGWMRDTAQRLLVERQDPAAVALLKAPFMSPKARTAQGGQESASPSLALSAIHALGTLDGLQALDEETLISALSHSNPRVREQAIRLAEAKFPGARNAQDPKIDAAFQRLINAILALASDSDARVRFQLTLTLGALEKQDHTDLLARLTTQGWGDEWQWRAVLCSLRNPSQFLEALAQRSPQLLTQPSETQAGFLQNVAQLIAGRKDRNDLSRLRTLINQSAAAPAIAMLAGLSAGLAPKSWWDERDSNQDPSLAQEAASSLNERFLKLASASALASDETVPARLRAIRVLSQAPASRAAPFVVQILSARQPAEVEAAAAQALAQWAEEWPLARIFEQWPGLTSSGQRQLLAAFARSIKAVPALLSALEQGHAAAGLLDASARQALRQLSEPALRGRVRELIGEAATASRDQAARRFEDSLKLEGDVQRGAGWFRKACLACHAIQGMGGGVGPDLSGLSSRPREAVLVDIVDPNRQLTPDFLSYRVQRNDGEILQGLIVGENESRIVLRRANVPDETILRRDIQHLRAEGTSLMPEGLEESMTTQDMADLLEFLSRPDRELLREE